MGKISFYMFFALLIFAAKVIADSPERNRPMSKEEQALAKQVKISFEDAKKIALKKAPGKIFNWELEKENGRIIYTFEIQLPNDPKYSREVNVAAMTGKIVAYEKEDLKTQLARAKKSS